MSLADLFADHFSSVAPSYAEFRPTYPEPLFDWIAGAAPARRAAWDCGCGSGQATVALASRFGRVAATDASVRQLVLAPRVPGVTWHCATAEASALAPGVADAVVVAQALHWFDAERFWDEVRRVGRPGGLVVACTYGRYFTGVAPIDAVLHHLHDDVMGPFWPLNRGYVDTSYATIPFPFARLAVPAFPMLHHWSLAELLGYVRTWSATQRYLAAGLPDPFSAATEALGPLWGTAQRPVQWPLTVVAGRLPA